MCLKKSSFDFTLNSSTITMGKKSDFKILNGLRDKMCELKMCLDVPHNICQTILIQSRDVRDVTINVQRCTGKIAVFLRNVNGTGIL
jgi:hypothetical protein